MMNEHDLLENLRVLQAEQDMLRARCDALAIALKYVIRSASDPSRLVDGILRAIAGTGERGIASPMLSDSCLGALEGMKVRIAKWR